MLAHAQHRGQSMLEYLIVGAIGIAVLGLAIWAVVQAASSQGGNVKTWIDGIGVPSSP